MSGKLIIFSAPSGSGKTTIVKHLLKNFTALGFSISATTRHRRQGEKEGEDYYFLSPEEFRYKLDNDQFAEWQEVYEGVYYGTLKSEVERLWSMGKSVIFDVDVKGGLNLKKVYQEKALAVFVKVPDPDELAYRLKSRGTESDENLKLRLEKVRYEMTFEDQFDCTLVNDDLDEALSRAEKIVKEFLGSS